MSAFKYLMFVIGIVVVAVYGSILMEFVNPFLSQAETTSSTTASATGVGWATQFFEWFQLIALALLVFALIVGIVNRRSQVRI